MASLQQRTEIRDGMRIDWDVPITMDDGLVLRADVFRPVKDGKISGHPQLRPLRQEPRLPGWLSKRLATHGGKASRRHRWVKQPLPELGSGRSGEMGAARLRLRARRFTRRRLLARLHRSFLAARDEGLLRLHRMGGRAALVERQSRPQRHFLLRHQPVARRLAAAAASRRDVHLGRRRRLVPRHDASWRHSLDVLGELVRHAGEDRAIRRRRARQAQPRARRAGVRTGNVVGRRARQETAPISAPRSRPIRWTTTITRRVRRNGTRSPRRCSRPPIGAARACIRAAISKASCAPRPSRNGWRRTASSTGRISIPTTAASSSCASSIISCTARKTAGRSSRRCCCRCATVDKFVPRAENEWPLKRTQMDQVLSRSRRDDADDQKAVRRRATQIRRHGRRPHLPHAAARAGNRNHRPIGAETVRIVVDAPTPTSSSCCACSPATSRKSCSRARSIRTRRSRKAGCAPRTASSTRNCRSPTAPITRTTRSSR